jgi:hypothetical protein
MVDSWRPPISEVHGLAFHGRAVRSFPVFSSQFSVFSKELTNRDSIYSVCGKKAADSVIPSLARDLLFLRFEEKAVLVAARAFFPKLETGTEDY